MNAHTEIQAAPTALDSIVRHIGRHPLLDQLRTIQDIAEGSAFGQCDHLTMQAIDRALAKLIEDAEYEDNRLAALITNGRPSTGIWL